jgi:hypothetical protein
MAKERSKKRSKASRKSNAPRTTAKKTQTTTGERRPRATALIQIKRAYDPPQARDGLRILIDRLWPRGQAPRAEQRAAQMV